MRTIITIFLFGMLTTCVVLNAAVPKYWLQTPDAYQIPKHSSRQLDWHDIKISDLPKECREKLRPKIKSLRLAKIDLNSDGINELIVNARPEAKIAGEYYIFMNKVSHYGLPSPKQYYMLYYKGFCGDQLVILEPHNGFSQFYVSSRSGMRYRSFQVYTMQQGGSDYVRSRSETHDFDKFNIKIDRGKLWGDYPDEMFTAALEHCLRTTVKKHYSDKIRQEDIKFSKSNEALFRSDCKIAKTMAFSLVYAPPGIKYKIDSGQVCREFNINSKRSLYYLYSQQLRVLKAKVRNLKQNI